MCRDMLTTAKLVDRIAVDHFWEDLSEHHRVTVIPNDVANTVEERRVSRETVTAFVVREGPGFYASDCAFDTE